jgi:hypothetical protein
MYRVTVQAGSWRVDLEVEFPPAQATYMPRTHDVQFWSSPQEQGRVRSCWCSLPPMRWWEIPFVIYRALRYGDYVEAEVLSVEMI